MSYDLPIERIVQPDILTCAPDTTLSEAAGMMSAARRSSILVMDGARVIGIWTERDALGVDFSAPEAFNQPIRQAMSAPVKTLHLRTSMGEAALRFKQDGVRHYLVVDEGGHPCGIITQSDVVQNQGVEFFVLLRDVRSVLRQEPLILESDHTLADAAHYMRESGRDAVVISHPDGELGILTERDIVRLISAGRTEGPVWEDASRPLHTVPAESSLYHARATFIERKIRHLGVTEGGQLIGLVTYGDILASIEHDYVRELQKALREREEQLNVSNRHLRLAEKVFETTHEGILVTDAEQRIESVNPAFSEITGYSSAEVVGKTPAFLSSGRHDRAFYQAMWESLNTRGSWQGEIWNRRKNGDVFPEWLTINTIRQEGEITNYVAIFSDITERKAAENHVRHLAYHDALTGLPNRSLFLEHLQHALTHAHRNRTQVALMFLDLDRFKLVNDTLGHTVGDRLLVEVAARITGSVREDDTVSRLGGDEFTVILEDIGSAERAAKVAQKIIDALATPLKLEGHEIFITTSIGISLYPTDCEDAETLVRSADAAMYRAKEQGRNNFQFFTLDMNAQALERLTMENSLRHALEREEFVLHYQPRVDLRTRQVTGVEALVRWQHPEFGLVPPSQFIPIAEENGLIVPLGEWVLRAACLQNKHWQEAGLPPVSVAVNLSARQFRNQGLVESIRVILEETGLDPHYLELEITESAAMERADDSVIKLNELKAMGVRISMDDFGTGHSSLSYLKQFPIDSLKIDKSFLQDTSLGSKDAAIAFAISAMAEKLNVKVITEGVETQDQLDFTTENRSDEGQGYFFSRPLPAEELTAILRDGHPPERKD